MQRGKSSVQGLSYRVLIQTKKKKLSVYKPSEGEIDPGFALHIKDPFCAWKPPLCHKDTAKGKKCFGCLELCLYGIRELATATS